MSKVDELVRNLVPLARFASANAYAPYSGYRVGAAVQTSGGATYQGCNVESDSFGLTQCAERNALGAAIAGGAKKGSIEALVIYLPGGEALPPCGACRQVMLELMSPRGMVATCCDAEEVRSWRVDQLLPDPFLKSRRGDES